MESPSQKPHARTGFCTLSAHKKGLYRVDYRDFFTLSSHKKGLYRVDYRDYRA